MKVAVKLLFQLKRYSPTGRADFELEITPGTTLGALLEQWGLPPHPPKVMLINGRPATRDQELADGDLVVIFPPVEGG